LNSIAVAYLDLGANEQAAQAFSQLLELQPSSLPDARGVGRRF